MKRVQLELNLPDDLAKYAESAGLLTPEALEELIQEEVRRRAWDHLMSIADRSAALGLTPMTEEEVQAEIDAVRAEKRRRRESRD